MTQAAENIGVLKSKLDSAGTSKYTSGSRLLDVTKLIGSSLVRTTYTLLKNLARINKGLKRLAPYSSFSNITAVNLSQQ